MGGGLHPEGDWKDPENVGGGSSRDGLYYRWGYRRAVSGGIFFSAGSTAHRGRCGQHIDGFTAALFVASQLCSLQGTFWLGCCRWHISDSVWCGNIIFSVKIWSGYLKEGVALSKHYSILKSRVSRL